MAGVLGVEKGWVPPGSRAHARDSPYPPNWAGDAFGLSPPRVAQISS
jgi:hypothetical protein